MASTAQQNPRFSDVLDLHVPPLIVIPLVLALILCNTFGPKVDWLLLGLVLLFPQGRIYTQLVGYRAAGRGAAVWKFLLLHEAMVLAAAGVTVAVMWPLF